MTKPLPKWIQKRYAILWMKFKDKSFTHEQAVKILKEDEQLISVFLSDLKKAEWLDVALDPKDTRKRFYRLKEPNQAVEEFDK